MKLQVYELVKDLLLESEAEKLLYTEICTLLGTYYSYLGNYTKSIEFFKKAKAVNYNPISVLLSLNDYYWHLDDFQNALSCLLKALDLSNTFGLIC